ncbi:SiaB family protein kinase [Limibacter armeniacum]|uniref:SiaB family protein kinase n=1 Tax=Limibacter armeniacum TaxID=466084 RepID=UPI002FE57C61
MISKVTKANMLQEKEYLEHFSVKTFKDQLELNHILLAFNGMFTQEVLTLIGKTLQSTPNSQMISKRLFAIVIEMAQNIHHYSAHKAYSEKDEKEVGTGVITIGSDDQYFHICSGNYIKKSEVPPLLERADYINELDKEELRDFYREVRKAPQRANKPGANLGLIDMVRKSGNPVLIEIEEVDDDISFFILNVKINKEL